MIPLQYSCIEETRPESHYFALQPSARVLRTLRPSYLSHVIAAAT